MTRVPFGGVAIIGIRVFGVLRGTLCLETPTSCSSQATALTGKSRQSFLLAREDEA